MTHFSIAIIGGGVSGSALTYMLSKYSSTNSIALFEKYEDIATLNSSALGNSQTLHVGDIETNYTLEKAKIVSKRASMILHYGKQYDYLDDFITKVPKMALGVGDEEIEYIKNRYEEFKEDYPYMEFWDHEYLAEFEPKLVEGRKEGEKIAAMGTKSQYSTVDFGKLSRSFVKNAKDINKDLEIYFNTNIADIEKQDDKYLLRSDNGEEFTADFVVSNAGAHSLYLAHKMGLGKEYGCLPVAGSFFYGKEKTLSSKVYTVQNPKLPFAAVHGDPDITRDGQIRFGPTALSIPKLERYKPTNFKELFKAVAVDEDLLYVLKDLMKDKTIRNYTLRNFTYELPIIGKYQFIKEINKIVPSMKGDDIFYAKEVGGVRPQVVDKVNKKLMLGEASIEEDGIIFNMTPSPGATSCMGNAYDDAKKICTKLGIELNEELIQSELLEIF